MQKRIVAMFAFAGLVVVAMATAAPAQPQGRPCEPDIQKLCKGVPFGGGKVRDCLNEHLKDLSPGCKAMHDSNQGIFAAGRQGAAQRRQGLLAACKPDLDKHCKGIEPGGGRLRDCLQKHQSELSDACKKVMSSAVAHGKPGQKPQGAAEQKPK
ncbi:MAG TPA: cysteine rich repeat-containing protein [Candidatus Binatia bacterium]|nr:cysteine rich repeat-containing protein [Candidatus Binatia bacterium]